MSYSDSPSILQKEKRCYLTGTTEKLERHHVFFGPNRRNSAKYGLWVYLRHDLHNEPPYGVHFNRDLNLALQEKAQRKFEETYPDLDFMKIFGRNYK